MPHLNLLLQKTSREVLIGFANQNMHRFIVHLETLATSVEDSGLPFDPTIYPTIRDFLRHAAGCDHGILRIRDILTESLLAVASGHVTKPEKAVATFLADLDRRSLGRFLGGELDQNLRRREAKLRYQLDKLGYRLIKSRKRNPLHDCYNLFDVVERCTNFIIMDAPRTLDRLECWVRTLSREAADVCEVGGMQQMPIDEVVSG